MTTPKVHKMSRLNNHVGPYRTTAPRHAPTVWSCVVRRIMLDHCVLWELEDLETDL